MKSRLYLETAPMYGCTRVTDMFFTPPYKIMSPFMTGAHADITVMAATAGLLRGDEIQQEFVFRAGSDVSVRTQSYEKVFDTEGGRVTRRVRLAVESGAAVRFLPHPVIPFENSDFDSEMTVELAPNASFVCADVFTCGRVGMGERFRMRRFRSVLRVQVGGRTAFADHTLIEPSRVDYRGPGQWRGFTHCGLLYACLPDGAREAAFLECARVLATERLPDGEAGASQALRGVCVRALAHSGEAVFAYFDALAGQLTERDQPDICM